MVEVSLVKNLGDFIEIEFLNSSKSIEEQVSELKSILSDIGIEESQIESEPYLNLLSKNKI